MKRMLLSGLVMMLPVCLLAGAVGASQGGEKFGLTPSETLLAYSKQKSGDPKVIADLVTKGADINIRDPNNQSTPLHYALRYRDGGVAATLLELGADINARDNEGRTPLHEAVSYMVYDIAQRLVEKGAKLNLRDVEGRSPLYNVIFWDARKQAVDLVNLFARYGFDFKNFADADFLNEAISRRRGEIAVIFLHNGIAFNDASLYEAARTGQEDVFRILAEKGCRPVENILHGACEAGNLNIVKALTEKGARPSEKDIDFCLYNGHKKAAQFLNPILKKESKVEVDLRSRCRLAPGSGSCKALFWAAYYDAATGKCQEFAYGGCGGQVPFEALDACRRVCEE